MKLFRSRGAAFAALSLVAFAAMSTAAAAAPVYKFVDLGTFGRDISRAYDINDAGVIVGHARSYGEIDAGFRRNANGLSFLLESEPGGEDWGSNASAVNNSGQIAGWAGTTSPDTPYRAARFQGIAPAGTYGLTADRQSFGRDINDAGVMVGSDFGNGANQQFAFKVGLDGVVHMLPTLAQAGQYSRIDHANGINNSGMITGTSDTGNGFHAFVIDAAGAIRDLGTLGGHDSVGKAINAQGVVAGYSSNAPGNAGRDHAFMTGPNGELIDLGTLFGDDASYAEAISDSGQVIGRSIEYSSNTSRAFLYEEGVMYDLNMITTDLVEGWGLQFAMGMNASGDIVGFGRFGDNDRAFLLQRQSGDVEGPDGTTRVPEPASLFLLGLGVAAIVRRRR